MNILIQSVSYRNSVTMLGYFSARTKHILIDHLKNHLITLEVEAITTEYFQFHGKTSKIPLV